MADEELTVEVIMPEDADIVALPLPLALALTLALPLADMAPDTLEGCVPSASAPLPHGIASPFD